MTLREARCAFSRCFAKLVLEAYARGYEAAFDEVTEHLTARDQTSDHMKNSLHHIGLAGDMILYRNGRFLSQTEDYRPLGEYWEQLGEAQGLPLAWGGRFSDGNHFSFAWEGRK